MSDLSKYNITYHINKERINIIIIANNDNTHYLASKNILEYKKYTDIGINILDLIGKAIDNKFYQLIKNHDKIIIVIFIGKTKISIQCNILQDEIMEEKILNNDLKTSFSQMKNKIKKLENIVEYLNEQIVQLKNKDDYVYFHGERISKSKKHLIINFCDDFFEKYNYIFDNNINNFFEDKQIINSLFDCLRPIVLKNERGDSYYQSNLMEYGKRVKKECNSHEDSIVPYIMGLPKAITSVRLSDKLFQLNLESLVFHNVQIFNFSLLKKFKGTHLHIIENEQIYNNNLLHGDISVTEDEFFDIIESLINLKHLTFITKYSFYCKYNFRPYFFEKMKSLESLTISNDIKVENLTKRVKINQISNFKYY